ncbi:antibiotic biosynthesis monooxygenase [Nocardiopsis sp. TSRI0078]|uniref:putative quinol monooxygenase n=1 Tax=unclassified Nocardiopsis TaxID=2649073 RepID=UPI00093F2B79|nr:antibiotic biosynthesis monooxygenase [Nocardiopsis sp. TSRI0078]OKI23563.1 antibiotic biosynthesis monooxygenase [Nocardiopsis sp. TSRI0078]
MFGLSVRFTLKDEAAADGFDALVAETLPHIRQSEPGTLVYAVHTVEDKPLERIFYELYADRAAFEAHEEQPHVKRFLDARGAFLASADVDFLDLVDAKGVQE